MAPFVEIIEEVPSFERVRRDIATYPQAAIDAMDLLTEHFGWKDPTYILAGFMELVDDYHDGYDLGAQQHAWASGKLDSDLWLPRLMEALVTEATLDGWRWPLSYSLPVETVTESNATYGMF